MHLTFKNLGLTAIFLSLAIPSQAAAGEAGLITRAKRTDMDAASRCSAIEALAAAKDDSFGKEISSLLSDSDETVRACAISALRGAGAGQSAAAAEALLSTVEDYQASGFLKGAYEENLKARLKAIDAIWALGEIGDPELMPRLEKFYSQADHVLRVNLVISMGRLKKAAKAGPYLYKIAADPEEAEAVRAAAFEMLDQIGYPSAMPSLVRSREAGIEKADLIFTGGIVGTVSGWVSPDFPIGHAGIFAGTEAKNGKINVVIADCVPNNFKPGGVRNIYSWYNFTHQYKFPFYGNRTTPVRPTAAQRERIVSLGLAMGRKGLRYNDTHLQQKGPLEFDCVGYTEYIYEAAGLNPTPSSYETGLGWPLTPFEQFAATRPGARVQDAAALPSDGHLSLPGQAALTNAYNSAAAAFGLKAADLPEINDSILPELID